MLMLQIRKHICRHKKNVLSVAFSADNHQIISGSREKTSKLWSTLGECKYTIAAGESKGDVEWVSCVLLPLVVSCVLWMGSPHQSLGPHQLQAPQRSRWSHWLP